MTATAYLFDNAGEQTADRFVNTHPIYDPRTIAILEGCGVREGASCLEVGGGGGSIAAWFARRVGPEGRVLVTDLDPRHLRAAADLRLPNVEVVQHDVGKDPLPAGSFDVIHSRLVIMHVPERRQVLGKLVDALKPGGWLVIEDFDPHLVG